MSEIDLITEVLGHMGALEQQVVELPKAGRMAQRGEGLVRLAIRWGERCGGEAEAELQRLHVPIVNRGFDTKAQEHYFDVEKIQASWGEYVLLRGGFEVVSKPIDPRNWEWAAGKGRVPAWSEKARAMRVGRGRSRQRAVVIRRQEPARGWLGRLLDWICGG